MIDTKNDLISFTDKDSEQLRTALERIFAAAQSGAVLSEPVVAGNYTIITASEVTSSGGVGSGMGFVPATPKAQKQPGEEVAHSEQANSGVVPVLLQNLSGGGIGAGGGATGRPVAIIIVGPDGVTVKPVFDLTKIALAGITAWITMLAVLRRVRRVKSHDNVTDRGQFRHMNLLFAKPH
jgi:uncharacterized spore protein YtfJ